jgi:hypothetical protein
VPAHLPVPMDVRYKMVAERLLRKLRDLQKKPVTD